jgi:hypothetical protein
MADVEKLLDVAPYLRYPSDNSPTTEQQYQDFVKNIHTTLTNTINTVKLWQPSTTYALGEIISSPNMKPNSVAKVTTAGMSNNIEPTWTAAGTTVEDNGCKYVIVRKCQEAATVEEAQAGTDTMKLITPSVLQSILAAFKTQVISDAHPIGEVWETTTDDDPNKLWPGTTWVKMDPGRVLVSSGDYTENGTKYSYTLGATGGEAKHQITVDELAAHSHSGSTSTSGGHNHTAYGTQISYKEPGWSRHAGTGYSYGDSTTSWSGNHSHTVTVGSTGGNVAHENRQPFEVVHRWKRTA